MEKKVKIAVIGSYAVGMTIVCEHFPAAGETVSGSKFKIMHGGKGSNQAVAVNRLGGECIYGGCVGKDSFGEMCHTLLKEEAMESKYIKQCDNKSTGVGLIYVNEEGENEIVIDLAANNELLPEDIDRMMPALKKCKLVLMQLEINPETVAYTAEKCKEAGIVFVLNPAPFHKLPIGLLRNCDYLIPNQTEARMLLGLSPSDTSPDEAIAEKIKKLGVKNVIVTLGKEGAIIVNEKLTVRIPGVTVQAVDTTGAGDTFSAAFCVAIAEGRNIIEAVEFGNAAAGLAVTKYGVIEAIPTRANVEAFMKERENES